MSARNWTPYQIEIIMHYNHSAGPFPRADAPIFAETVAHLVEIGMLDRGDFPHTTPLGAAFVEMLLQTPAPKWMIADPRTGKEVPIEVHVSWVPGSAPLNRTEPERSTE